MRKAFLILLSLLILLPFFSLFFWVFTERWPWPNILPKDFSERALKSTIARSGELGNVFFTSILLSLLASFFSVLIAVLSGRALAFYDFPGKRLISSLMLLPFLVPSTVFSMGAQILFLKTALYSSIPGVLLCHILYSLPYANILLNEGTRALGEGLEEQARVLGAGPVRAFFSVSLPNLFPLLLSAFTMSYVISISQYFMTLLIGGGRVKTFAVVMVPYLQSGERNFAALYALIFLLVTTLVFFVFEGIARACTGGRRTELFSDY